MPGNTGRASAKHFRKPTLRRSIQYPLPPYHSSHAQRPSPAPSTHPAVLGANYQISQKKAKSPFHGSSCLLSPERSSVPQPLSHPATANPTDSLSPSRHLFSTLPALTPGTTDTIPSVQVGQQTKPPPGRQASLFKASRKQSKNKQTKNQQKNPKPLTFHISSSEHKHRGSVLQQHFHFNICLNIIVKKGKGNTFGSDTLVHLFKVCWFLP